jgi:transcriptional regulator with XRE-family HTH domain
MITNERQYRATKAAARIFEEALEHEEEQGKLISPRIRSAMHRGITSELAQLRAQLQDYEDFRAGKVRVLTIERLEDLPDVLIRARIASGLTQRELAEELDIKEQQVQRYEATRYKSASMRRLVEVAQALEIEVRLTATLPDPVAFRAKRRENEVQVAEMMARVAEQLAAEQAAAPRDEVA